MSAQSVVAAVLQAVRGALSNVDVFDAQVLPEPPQRYVVVYPDAGTRDADTVASESNTTTFRWQVTSVAPDREMAGWLAEAVQDALTGARLNVDGWMLGRIRHSFSIEAGHDETVLERPTVVAIDRYELLADRVPTQEEEGS